MIQVHNKGNNGILIIDTKNGATYEGAAIFRAYSDNGKTISIRTGEIYGATAFTAPPAEIEINGVSQTNISEAIQALNSFIGSFRSASATGGNSGGGVSPEDMLWKYEGILENKYYWSEPDEHGYPYYPTFYVDLKDRTETCVLSEISESPNMQITLPPAKVGFVTTCALLLKINDYAPNGTSIEFPRNVVWSGGVAPDFSLKNGYYRIVFNIYSDNKVLADVFIY